MTTDITELTSVQKNANIHRLSRLIAYAPNDELRQLAVEVEQYTDQLIEALEKAQRHANLTEAEGQAYLGLISKRDERIAELESRTVKLLPTIWYEHDDYAQEIAVLEKSRVLQALTAAGIKWEAE